MSSVRHGVFHAHSMFSLHDSTQTPEEMVKWAKEHGCESITLTDHGSLLGVDDFMEAGQKYGVNTIPGVETYLENREHLILIPMDNEGFTSISHAIREANVFQEKVGEVDCPIMKDEILMRFKGNTHVIASSACIKGPIANILLSGYQIKKKLQKEIAKADILKEAETKYETAKQSYEMYAEKVKELKRSKTEYTKFLNDSYLKRIEKSTGETREAMEALKNKAEEMVPKIEKKIAEFTEQRKSWKKCADRLKNTVKKKAAIMEQIQNTAIPDQQELYERAKEKLCYLKSIFPYFFLEVQYHGLEQERLVMPLIVQLARETDTPLIAGQDAHMTYDTEDCVRARQIVRFNYFKHHQEVSEVDRTLYLMTDQQLEQALLQCIDAEAVKEALENVSILKDCHVRFVKENHYPKCRTEQNFESLLMEARNRKVNDGTWNETYEARLQREMKIISEMGYIDYHLVVRDYCNEMRKLGTIPRKELKNMPLDFSKADAWIEEKGFRTGIGVGPGRGSAAGSLVCYLLGITNIDPIKYGLLFDRYLNPERVSMPDIDTDVKTSLRPYIIRYLKWKYGERAVCSIMTKTTYAAKNSIQMAGRDRMFELFPKEKDRCTKNEEKRKAYRKEHTLVLSDMIPETPGITLSACESMFQKKYMNDPEKCLIWKRAKLLEGKLSSTGVHAGGIVISDNDNINDYVPLAYSEDDEKKETAKKVWAAQCDMIQIENKGLLKMDLLGLNTLDVLSDCLQLVEKHHGIAIDIDHIEFEEDVFREIYAKGNTNSVFQFESSGMKSMLKEFQPTCFEDLILLVAAYRPGPMQFLPDIIARKHHRIPLTYRIKELEPILATTYGGIIYQEQVMQIFQSLAGYSLGQADLVRRAMSKKKEEKLKVERTAFVYGDEERGIKGCVSNGIDAQKADELFDELIEFAKYAFNKSHAAAYALVSYQTAWLKYHYPVEFQCAMFNNKDVDKYQPVYEDCRGKIEILPLSIQASQYEFTIEDQKIRYGFHGIKGVGEIASVTPILWDRKQKGFYRSFGDFLLRNASVNEKGKWILPNKKLVQAFIDSGCFDCVANDREELNRMYEEVASKVSHSKESLESIIDEREKKCDFSQKNTKYNREQEANLLGNIISENPLKKYREEAYYGCAPIGEIPPGISLIMGYVSAITEKTSRSGNEMLIINLVGETGTCDVMFMKKRFTKAVMDVYLNQVIRMEVSTNDGSHFGRAIQMLRPTDSGYYLNLDTLEKTNEVAGIMNSFQSTKGSIRLTVQFHYKKTGEPFNRPYTKEYLVSLSVINSLHAQRILMLGREEYKKKEAVA